MSETHVRIIGLIPARAGSKRVQGKNTRIFGGHPLIAHTIAAAVQSSIFSEIVVSTDSPETARIAEYYGAAIPFLRPAEFALDLSPDIEWITDMLARLAANGREFDCFSILRPTSPFRQAETIRRAWDMFLRTPGIDSLRAVEKCKQHPGKMWVIHGSIMAPLLLHPPGTPWHSMPYQALPDVYVQNASLEIAWTRVVFQQGSIAGKVVAPFLTEGLEGYDINEPRDWEYAERLIDAGAVSLPRIQQQPFRA